MVVLHSFSIKKKIIIKWTSGFFAFEKYVAKGDSMLHLASIMEKVLEIYHIPTRIFF